MYFNDILTFWFHEIEPKRWWKKDKKFDELLRYRFLNIYYDAINSKLKSWRISEKGRLAEIIVIDQFSRNLFRDKPDAYYHDSLAIFLSKELIHLKLHLKCNALPNCNALSKIGAQQEEPGRCLLHLKISDFQFEKRTSQ